MNRLHCVRLVLLLAVLVLTKAFKAFLIQVPSRPRSFKCNRRTVGRLQASADDGPSPLVGARKTSPEEVVKVAQDYVNRLATSVKDLDSDTATTAVTDWSRSVSRNVLESFDINVRGELWAVAPPALLLLCVYGHIPFGIGAVAKILSGPGLVILGSLTILAGFVELGGNLSPWPQPTQGNELITSGIFSLVRHPIYSGILLFALGLSVATAEFERLLVTVLLFLTIEKKVEYEEAYLQDKHVGYKAYKEQTAKYFPFIY